MKKTLLLLALIPSISFADSSNTNLEIDLWKKISEISSIDSSKNECKWILAWSENEEDESKTDEHKNDFSWLFWRLRWNTEESVISTISSFTEIFSWNYCFQRDLKKINKVYKYSLDKWSELSLNCHNTTKISEITDEIEKIKDDFFERNKGPYWKEELYWDNPINCSSDFFNELSKKTKELVDKTSSITDSSSELYNFDFSFEKAEENAKRNARNRLKSNLESYTIWFWLSVDFEEKNRPFIKQWENFVLRQIIEWTAKFWTDVYNAFSWNGEKMDIDKLLSNTEKRHSEKENIDYNLENFPEVILSNLSESSTDNILDSLANLEMMIITAEWTKEDLEKIWLSEDKNNMSLKRFDQNMIDFIQNHNEAVFFNKRIVLKNGDYNKN